MIESNQMAELIIPKLKLYLDTTIPNYLFADHYPDKKEITRQLMLGIKASRYVSYISDVVLREMTASPETLLIKMMAEIKDIPQLKNNTISEELANVYIKEGIFRAKSIDDARHVAIAVINNMDAVVSWNFGHLVNLVKIKKVNIVNEIMGYKHIEINSPQEVIDAKS